MNGKWSRPHLFSRAMRSPLQDGPVTVHPAHVGGTNLSTWASAFQDQANAGLRVKGVDHPGGIEPLSTRPPLRRRTHWGDYHGPSRVRQRPRTFHRAFPRSGLLDLRRHLLPEGCQLHRPAARRGGVADRGGRPVTADCRPPAQRRHRCAAALGSRTLETAVLASGRSGVFNARGRAATYRGDGSASECCVEAGKQCPQACQLLGVE